MEHLSSWLTIEEFAKATGKGQRTIERLITQQRVVTAKHQRQEGRKPITVIDPTEIQKIIAQTLRPVVQSAIPPTRQSDRLPATPPLRQPDMRAILNALERLRMPFKDTLYLTKREAALYLGFPQAEVERNIAIGAIPTTRLSNGWLRIAREDLDWYYQSRRQMAGYQNDSIPHVNGVAP